MGFRTGAFATIWDVKIISDACVKCKLSTSRKNKDTGEYESDFNGFVDFIGTSCAKHAASLHPMSRVKLGDVDVTTNYVKSLEKEYVNYKVFNFELVGKPASTNHQNNSEPQPSVDDGEVNDERLPF